MTQGFEHWSEKTLAEHNARVARQARRQTILAPAVQDTLPMNHELRGFTLILPWPPSNNHYKGNRVIVPKDRSKKPFLMYYLTEEAKRFQAQAAAIARAQGVPVLQGCLSVSINYFFPTKAGDLTNRDKVLLDVLQGIAYVNDKQITRKVEERFSDKDNPRVEITIQERP